MQSTSKTIRQAPGNRIRQFVVPVTLAIAALGGQSTLGAQSYTLDFGAGLNAPSICTANPTGTGPLVLCSTDGNPGIRVSQSYGDVAGIVNDQYAELGNDFGRSLNWWNTGYGNRTNVLYSPSGSARINLIPVAGKQITLNSFLLAAFGANGRATTLNIFEIGNATALFTFAGLINGVTSSTFAPALGSSSTGFSIEWVQATGGGVVAIDDLSFTVSNLNVPPSVVPEPATWALMGTGLAMLGVVARRRRV